MLMGMRVDVYFFHCALQFLVFIACWHSLQSTSTVDVVAQKQDGASLVVLTSDAALQGFVYLKFASTEAASAAQKAFHGRWFAGRQLVVNYEFAQPYSAYFRC